MATYTKLLSQAISATSISSATLTITGVTYSSDMVLVMYPENSQASTIVDTDYYYGHESAMSSLVVDCTTALQEILTHANWSSGDSVEFGVWRKVGSAKAVLLSGGSAELSYTSSGGINVSVTDSVELTDKHKHSGPSPYMCGSMSLDYALQSGSPAVTLPDGDIVFLRADTTSGSFTLGTSWISLGDDLYYAVGQTLLDITFTDYTGNLLIFGYCNVIPNLVGSVLSGSGTSTIAQSISDSILVGSFQGSVTSVEVTDHVVRVVGKLFDTIAVGILPDITGTGTYLEFELEALYLWANKVYTETVSDSMTFGEASPSETEPIEDVSSPVNLTDSAVESTVPGLPGANWLEGFGTYGTGTITTKVNERWTATGAVTEASGIVSVTVLESWEHQTATNFGCWIKGVYARVELGDIILQFSNASVALSQNGLNWVYPIEVLTSGKYIEIDSDGLLWVDGVQQAATAYPLSFNKIKVSNCEIKDIYVGTSRLGPLTVATLYPATSVLLEGVATGGSFVDVLQDNDSTTYVTLTNQEIRFDFDSYTFNGSERSLNFLANLEGTDLEWYGTRPTTQTPIDQVSTTGWGYIQDGSLGSGDLGLHLNSGKVREFAVLVADSVVVIHNETLSDPLSITDVARRRQDESATSDLSFTDSWFLELEDYRRDVSDTIDLTDSMALNSSFSKAFTDVLDFTDEVKRTLDPVLVSSSVMLTDSTPTTSQIPAIYVTDSIGFSDVTGSVLNLEVAKESSLGVYDTLDTTLLRTWPFQSPLGLVDQATVDKLARQILLEPLTLSDSVSVFNFKVQDSASRIQISDSVDHNEIYSDSATDSITLTDVESSRLLLKMNAIEDLGLEDVVKINQVFNLEVCDCFDFTDSPDAPLEVSIIDTLSLIDSIKIPIESILTLTDSVTTNAQDLPCCLGPGSVIQDKLFKETLSLSDAVTVSGNFGVSVSDTLAFLDSGITL